MPLTATPTPPAERAGASSGTGRKPLSFWTSHEMRTPLTAILGFAQLLQLDELEAHQQESVSYILNAGRHLLAIVDEGVSPRPAPVSRDAVAVEPLVGEIVGMLAPLAAARGVGVEVDLFAVCGARVRGDGLRVRQVLLNLLSNAVKYNRANGKIIVRGEIAGERLCLHVTDTGEGIAAHHLPDLFKPFERLGAEHGPQQGTGLGLSLSRQMAQLMGGSLSVRSELGVGSTFTLELPTERRAAP